MQAWSNAGMDITPKSRKARALLALIALTETRSIGRERVAALLWSNLERAVGLARLRDTLHHLQKDLRDAGLEALLVKDATISFHPGAVWIDIDDDKPDGQVQGHSTFEFLVEFEGIDPALDRWLTRVREERYQRGSINAETPETGEQAGPRIGLCVGPSIVVTAFDTDGSKAEEQFVKSLTEEVATALARLRWFTVITRSRHGRQVSSGSEDLSKIADYALVGTLQRDENHYRLSLKLIELTSCAIVWATSLAQENVLSFTVQEKFANSAAARIDTELLFIEVNRNKRQARASRSSAYSLVLDAIPAIYRLEREPFLGAGHALEQAISLDRELAMAHSWLAYWHVFFVGQGWALNSAQSMTRAGKAADRAMMLDPKDARGVTVAGHVKAFLSRRLDEATSLHELALQLNPALALAWHFAGVTHAYAGRLDEALRCITQCRELAPSDPHGFFAEGALGIVTLLRHDHEAAVTIGRRVTERHPHFTSAYKSYLSALGHLGQRSEAVGVLQRLRLLEPRFSLQRFYTTAPYQRSQDLEHYTAGLRLAGVT